MTRSTSSEPLRILFISREYPPETGGGGIGSYVQAIGRALAARGHEVHVLSCSPGQENDDRLDGGVNVHRRGAHRLLFKIRRRFPGSARRIEGAIACYVEFLRLRLDVDVVEAPDWLAEGLVVALLRRSRPLVAHLHTPISLVARHNPGSFTWGHDAYLADILERTAVRRADVVTSPSELLARDLKTEGWLGHHDPSVIRYPLDADEWNAALPAGATPPRVLAVGRLEARKAPEVVLKAAAMLVDAVPQLEVVFVGRSSLRNGRSYLDWLTELAEELRSPCRFVGEVPREELLAWYESSRVVAIASRYDNFPFAALEAMAAARPVVCSARTGTAELLSSGRGGAVVPPADPGALAAALRPFLLDPRVAEQAGRDARDVVERQCCPDRVAELREACYREAIVRRRQKRSTAIG